MLSLKRIVQIAGVILIAMFIAACGSSTTTGSGSSGATPSTAPSITPIIKTATATVKGQSESILTNDQGRTLYYFTADAPAKVACTGTCAGVWPPLLFSATGSPTSATSLPGTLSVVTDASGMQVEYNGHPLYTYSKDTAPGQTNGEGLFGKWFVATPMLSGTTTPASTPTPSGYGY
jgi:predicted lipoprotein with Yx(FWY)xxD motif